jgi:hypothetical protein
MIFIGGLGFPSLREVMRAESLFMKLRGGEFTFEFTSFS